MVLTDRLGSLDQESGHRDTSCDSMMNTSSPRTTPLNLSSSSNLTVPKQRENRGADKHRRTLRSIDTQADSRNSSAKIWAEDYYTFDFSNEGSLDEETKGVESCLPEQAPSFFTTRPSQQESSAQKQRRHTRSLTTFLPSFRTNSNSPKTSPTKEPSAQEIEDEFMPTLTGDRGGVINVADKSKGGLASWFAGSSASVAVGIHTMEDNMATILNSSRTEFNSTPKQLTSPPITTPAKSTSSTESKFNFFSSPKTPKATTTIQIPVDLNNDDLLTLDIEAALFPAGRSSEDPFSPASFKNLLMNAEGLLLKIQTAYKIRTIALHEISDEKETMKDELDEVQIRAQCFKTQIEDLAHQNSVKEEKIKALQRELLAEREARAAEKEAREKSIALIRENAKHDRKRVSDPELSIDTHLGGEDLGIASAASVDKRKWRSSANSTDISAADEDSDVESRGGESVFSRSLSPTLTQNTFSASSANISLAGTDISTPEILQASLARVISPSASHPQPLRPKPVQQRSTFQKMLTSITATPESTSEKDSYDGIGLGEEGCSNCQGKDASVAWDTVGLMRAENRGLKERVGQLESAIDGALDFISAPDYSRRIIQGWHS